MWLKETRYRLARERREGYSQHGEDKFLLDYFKGRKGIYLDIGSSHPFIISNTYLLYRHGWRGVCVEPIPYLWGRYEKFRPGDKAINCLVGREEGETMFYNMIPSVLSTCDENVYNDLVAKGGKLREARKLRKETLASIYSAYLSGQAVDLLSIDVEGFDLEVLQGNDWSIMRPEIIVCEVNDEADRRVDDYLLPLGYELLKTIACNRIYRFKGN